MRFIENVVIKKIAGTNVLLPIGQAMTEGIIPVELSEEENYLVKVMIQGNATVERLVEKILVRYQVTVEEARNMVDSFLSECREFGYILEDN